MLFYLRGTAGRQIHLLVGPDRAIFQLLIDGEIFGDVETDRMGSEHQPRHGLSNRCLDRLGDELVEKTLHPVVGQPAEVPGEGLAAVDELTPIGTLIDLAKRLHHLVQFLAGLLIDLAGRGNGLVGRNNFHRPAMEGAVNRAEEAVGARSDRVGHLQLEDVLAVQLKTDEPAVVVGLGSVEGAQFLGGTRAAVVGYRPLLDQARLGNGLVDLTGGLSGRLLRRSFGGRLLWGRLLTTV